MEILPQNKVAAQGHVMWARDEEEGPSQLHCYCTNPLLCTKLH